MAKKTIVGIPRLESVLSIVGENIRLARLRRKISAMMLAERAGISRVTLNKIEQGAGSVAMAAYANVLFCLGLEQDLLKLARDDLLGRRLQDAGLTYTKKRVARRQTQASNMQ